MEQLMYTPLESVFQSTMQREGREVTACTSGQIFQAFMRRNDDGNNIEDRITLFYNIGAPVNQGSIIAYGNKKYILLNRETEENQCYYKSSAIALNGVVNINDGEVYNVPCYGYDMNSGLVEGNNVISIISGNMDFITEDNETSRKIKIGQTFNEFGRTWKISNVYYKDGVLHLVTEVYADVVPTVDYTIAITGLNSNAYIVGDTAKAEATLYRNGMVTTGTVVWKSSDTTIATIDASGNISFIAEGTVIFTATWEEQNVLKQTGTITVTASVVPTPTYITTITGGTTIWCGRVKSWNVTFKNEAGNEITGVDFAWNVVSAFDVIQTVTDNKVTLKVVDENVIGELFTLQVLLSGVVATEVTIRVIEAF